MKTASTRCKAQVKRHTCQTSHATRHTPHATRHTPHATRLTKAKGLQRTLKVARKILVRPFSVVDAEIKAPRILWKTSTEMNRMRLCEWANYIIELLFKKQKMQQTKAGVERRPLRASTMSQDKTIGSEWSSSKMCYACNNSELRLQTQQKWRVRIRARRTTDLWRVDALFYPIS